MTSPIHEDAPFYDASLAPKGAGAGFATTIPPGMRAFAVHVNEVVGVAGFAVPGMRVDLLVSGTPPATAQDGGAPVSSVTRTLLQNIQVLSAGQNYQKDAEGKPVLVQVVNLLVTPAEAEILNLATQQNIQLVLRNPADREIVSTPGASTINLFTDGKARPPRYALAEARRIPTRPALAAAPEKPRTITIEVYQGPKRIESTFRDLGAPPVIEAQP